MNVTGFHSPVDEKLVLALSTHWIKYVMPCVTFAVIMTASIAFTLLSIPVAATYPLLSVFMLFSGMVLSYFVMHWFFHRLLSEAMEDIIITNRRIIWIEESLYQIDNMRQIPLDKIQGVEALKHGIIQTILGYGCIWFDTGGTVTTDENATMMLVPHPHRLAREINHLRNLK